MLYLSSGVVSQKDYHTSGFSREFSPETGSLRYYRRPAFRHSGITGDRLRFLTRILINRGLSLISIIKPMKMRYIKLIQTFKTYWAMTIEAIFPHITPADHVTQFLTLFFYLLSLYLVWVSLLFTLSQRTLSQKNFQAPEDDRWVSMVSAVQLETFLRQYLSHFWSQQWAGAMQ